MHSFHPRTLAVRDGPPDPVGLTLDSLHFFTEGFRAVHQVDEPVIAAAADELASLFDLELTPLIRPGGSVSNQLAHGLAVQANACVKAYGVGLRQVAQALFELGEWYEPTRPFSLGHGPRDN